MAKGREVITAKGIPPDREMRNPAAVGAAHGADRNGQAGEHDQDQSYHGVGAETTLQGLLSDFYGRADPSRELLAYMRREALPMAELYAFAGMIAVAHVRFFPGRRFDFDDEGMPAVVIEALGQDAETVEDLVAWPLDRLDKFATALGRVRGLGVDQVRDPATYAVGKPLHVHRTPLGWLQSGCRGVVILEPTTAVWWLGDALGAVAGEDAAHAREIGCLLHPYVEPRHVLFPVRAA